MVRGAGARIRGRPGEQRPRSAPRGGVGSWEAAGACGRAGAAAEAGGGQGAERAGQGECLWRGGFGLERRGAATAFLRVRGPDGLPRERGRAHPARRSIGMAETVPGAGALSPRRRGALNQQYMQAIEARSDLD